MINVIEIYFENEVSDFISWSQSMKTGDKFAPLPFDHTTGQGCRNCRRNIMALRHLVSD